MEIILQLVIITAFLSIVFNTILKKYDLPPIIGYIVAGAIITYIFSLRETSLHTLYEISEFGIAFLMFTIGLEFSIKNFKKLKKEVFLFGLLQVVITTIFFLYISYTIFMLPLKTSIVIAAALALSSTAIVLKILNENRDIRKDYGRIVLGILLFQDLAVIPILLMLTFFTTTGITIETMLINTFISAMAVIGILFIIGKYLISPFLSIVFDTQSHELFIGTVLLIALSSSYLAYYFGFSYSLGAFIGGMLLAETPFKHQVEADLTPFRDLLLGVFFVTVGMQISFDFLVSNMVSIALIVSAVMILKGVLIFLLLFFFTTKSNAIKSAVALSQIGEFSFVILELARIGGITTKDINQTLIIAVVFSMIITPFIVKNIQSIVRFILRAKTNIQEPISSAEVSGHIIVIGYGSLGQQVCKVLKAKGMLYMAIDNKRVFVNESQKKADPFVLGNAKQRRILSSANIRSSAAVIITLEDDDETTSLIETIYSYAPMSRIVVSSRNDASNLLKDKRIRSFVHEHKEVASSMVLQALTCDIKN